MLKNLDGVFKPKRVNFAQVSNTALQDDHLSLKAKGLYALIQSMITLPNEEGLKVWKISVQCKEGDSAFESAWKELKKCGYLKQYRIPNSKKKGHFRYEYELLDNPDLSAPSMVNLTAKGEISTVHSQPDSTDKAPKKHEKKPSKHRLEAESDHTPENRGDGTDHTPSFPPYGQSTPCSNHPVQKAGGNSNTKSGNTLSGNTPVGNTLSVSLPPEDTDRSTDEVRSGILEQIEYDWIEETHPNDTQAVKALVDCIVDMETVSYTRISRVKQSRYALKKRLDTVSAEDVINFIDHMRGVKPKNIRNINAYWKSAFINYLVEQDLALSTV